MGECLIKDKCGLSSTFDDRHHMVFPRKTVGKRKIISLSLKKIKYSFSMASLIKHFHI